MIVKLYPQNPSKRILNIIVDVLQKGGVIAYPTDSVYAFGCNLYSKEGYEKLAKLKNLDPNKAHFSLIFSSISQIVEYTYPLRDEVFNLMKRNLPGPFTFIIEANNKIPRLLKNNRKKTIGVRIPDNKIAIAIVEALGNPIFTSSIISDDDIVEYLTDPELIHEKYKDQIDLVVDGGLGKVFPSTIVDCTGNDIKIIRQGAGQLIF